MKQHSMSQARLQLGMIVFAVSAVAALAAARYDFDGDGRADPALYSPYTAQWLVLLSGADYAPAVVDFEGLWLAPLAADFDGDRLADPGGYDEANAALYVRLSGGAYAPAWIAGFGGEGFTAVAADFDGDRKADPALYGETTGAWLALLSARGYAAVNLAGFGGPGWAPAPADYDGDGITDLAVYCAGGGVWALRTSRDGAEHELALGAEDTIPVPGDYDGDQRDDPAVYRESDGAWAVRLSASGTIAATQFGGWDYRPAPGDYDGDGKSDLVLHCASNGLWSARLSLYAYAGWAAEGDYIGAVTPDSLAPHPLDDDQPLPYTRLNWMSSLADSNRLSQVTIPGTHDSGADLHTSRLWGIIDQFVICQDFRLANQLRLGVRWFDIRLRLFNGGLCVHHGAFYLHKNFDDLLQSALDFLQPGSPGAGETVVFMIKQEYSGAGDREFGAAVYERLQARGLANFYLENRVPTLGEVRGKIVIVRRFDNGLGVDFGMQFDWDDNTKGASFSKDGIDVFVQDHYSLNTVPYGEKIGEVENALSLARAESDPLKFYLNYLSGQQDASLIPIRTVAANIHPAIRDYLASRGAWRRCGVVMLDFAGGSDRGGRGLNPELAGQIIELNGSAE